MSSQEAFQAAKDAFRTGDKNRAFEILLQIVDQDPNHLQAWQVLSRLTDNPQDQKTALEHVLALRPGDIQAKNRLQALRQAHPQLFLPERSVEPSALCEQKLYEAYGLSKAGLTAKAVELLLEVTELNPKERRAWTMLSEIHPKIEERIRALEALLTLAPEDTMVREKLDKLKVTQEDPFKRARFLEERGLFKEAIDVYLSVAALSRSATERIEADRRISDLRLRQEADQLQPVNPTHNLARLALGPLLLFALMLFMQSGLNPLHLPLLAFPGLLSVLAGSLMVSVTGMRPVHPKWIEWFGSPGSHEELEVRSGVRILGWALMLAPFSLFLIEASHRLVVLQSAVLSSLP